MDYRFDTIALAVSQHYRLLKTILSERTGLRPLTDGEARMADYLADVVETVAGKKVAGYCREQFRRAWTGGDLRSYKIKFVLLRLRDVLKGDRRDELMSRIEDLTTCAEELAGCRADGKRRNREAVAERALRRKERLERKMAKAGPEQLLLFEGEGTVCAADNAETAGNKSRKGRTSERTARKDRKSAKERKDRETFERMADEILRSEYGNTAERQESAYGADGDDFSEALGAYGFGAGNADTRPYDDLDADYGWGTRGEYDYN